MTQQAANTATFDMNIDAAMQEYLDRAAEFHEELLDGYARRAEQGFIDQDLRLRLGAAGLIAPELPSRWGGADERARTSGKIVEQISRGDINVGYIQVVQSLVGQILVRNAVDELAGEWIPKMTSGEDLVAIGLSEPEAGSDAGSPRTVAERRDDGWVIQGKKSMSFALHAGATVIFARTEPTERRGRGISAFLVELDRPGITRIPTPDIGTHAVGRGFVEFDRVWVPERNLLGEPGAAFTQVMQGFDFSRALIGLQVLGAAQISLDETYQYITEREAFGQPISKFQGVSFPLAEADTMVTAARVLCEKTLALKDAGLEHTKEAAMCKWWAPKLAHEVIQQCLLSHGQFGYLTTRPLEQRMRDVLGLQIGDGTAQIMKLIIGRHNMPREFAP